MKTEELQKKATSIRLESLRALHRASCGHVGSCMSVVEILVALYYEVMRFDARKPGWDEQDYLVLGKGQAAATLYAVLADLGFFEKIELSHLAKVNGVLQARPHVKVPGVSLGSLSPGHGLSLALGLALSLRMERKGNKVFAILGDGELQCGQVWEAAAVAAHHNLGNLIAFVDDNKAQGGGLTKAVVDPQFLQTKLDSFGWKVIQVKDGHDFDEILNAVQRAYTTTRRPVCIWCHTVCAKGIDFAEGKVSYQEAGLSDPEMNEILERFKQLI